MSCVAGLSPQEFILGSESGPYGMCGGQCGWHGTCLMRQRLLDQRAVFMGCVADSVAGTGHAYRDSVFWIRERSLCGGQCGWHGTCLLQQRLLFTVPLRPSVSFGQSSIIIFHSVDSCHIYLAFGRVVK